MYNAEEAKKALFGRVGWKKQPNSFKYDLSADNIKSLSGRNFQSFHKIVTLKNILYCIEDENADSEEFNEYLKDLQNDAILACLSGIFNEDELLEQSFIIDNRTEDVPETKEYSGKTVGYKLKSPEDNTYIIVIKSVMLFFDNDTDIKLFCCHSKIGTIWEKIVHCEEKKQTIIPIDDLILQYSTESYKGGFFYFGYEADNLTPLEFRNSFFLQTNILGYVPFEYSDINTIRETTNTYGLNIEFCAYRDFTEIIKNNASLFDTAIGLQVAATVVELILNSDRSNSNERIAKEAGGILYNDLNTAYPTPEFPYTTGLKNQLSREIKRLKKNLLPRPTSRIVTPCFS